MNQQTLYPHEVPAQLHEDRANDIEPSILPTNQELSETKPQSGFQPSDIDINNTTLRSDNMDDLLGFDVEIPTISGDETRSSFTEIEDESRGSLVFGILGLGQGGGRVAESFFKMGYKKCLVVNTAQHDLEFLRVDHKLRIGSDDGAGKNMDLAAHAFLSNRSEILLKMTEVFGENIDGILVCVGAGGGTGSGASLPAVELARVYMRQLGIENASKRVGAIVTIPTKGELNSTIVKNNALKVLTSLSDEADKGLLSPFIIIDNEKARKMFPSITVSQFYPTINKTIAQLFTTFNIISTKKSELISFDKADYRSIIFNTNEPGQGCSSHMIFGAANIRKDELEAAFNEYGTSGPSKILSTSIRNNLESTMLASDFDLQSAHTVGSIIVGGQELFDNVSGLMEAVEDAFSTISYLTGNATVHRGLYTDNSNSIKIYTIVGGLDRPRVRYRKLANM